MTNKKIVKLLKFFMGMLNTFLQEVRHTLKDFCHSVEDIVVGIMLRKVVDWHDKRKGQYVSREKINSIKNTNCFLKQIIEEIQSKQMSNLNNLKTQVETANNTISKLNADLKKLRKEVNELN